MNVLTFLLTFSIFPLDVSHSTFFYSCTWDLTVTLTILFLSCIMYMQGNGFSQHVSGSLWSSSVFSLGIRMYSQDRSGQPVFLCPSQHSLHYQVISSAFFCVWHSASVILVHI